MKPTGSASKETSPNRTICYTAVIAAVLLGIFMRVPLLRQRPMHTDEAVHAVKFGSLLKDGCYTYDPNEYHGPALNYFTLVPAWLRSEGTITEVTETTLRIVPVFFGIVIILLTFLIIDAVGPVAAVCIAFLTAASPAMVFYSRYYIQEMLLVCFTFGVIVCGYRYLRLAKPRSAAGMGWAAGAGVFLGLAHTAKETFIIAAGAALLSLVVSRFVWHGRNKEQQTASGTRPIIIHILLFLLCAGATSALFYSSFFTNFHGITDSVATYANYFRKAGHSSSHIYPWYYYLKMLIFSRVNNGPVWSEGFILLMAVAGAVFIIHSLIIQSRQVTFFAVFYLFYTAAVTIIYSAIPYKTPWCMLSFLHGFIILAGIGIAAIIKGLKKYQLGRAVTVILLASLYIQLLWQSYQTSYVYDADYRNPYVYAHTTTDIFPMAERILEAADKLPDTKIQVVCPDNDYWPLPWYLRRITSEKPARIGFWDKVTDDVTSVGIIIASADFEGDIINKLYHKPAGQRQMYMYLFDRPYHLNLRPGVSIVGLIRKDLWEKLTEKGIPVRLLKKVEK